MALQLVLGNSGSGKSTFLYENIIQRAKENRNQTFFVIVPEQFTMQTQRELVERAGMGIMNIDVVSFQRLAYRIFDELGKQDVVVLEDTGKNLLLRRIASLCQDELTVLAGNMKKMGYITEIKSLITELTQYRISPEDFEGFLQKQSGEGISESFRQKMQDVLLLYRRFQEELEGRYITAEDLLDLLDGVASQSAILQDSVLVLDGFTGFTPIQNQLLETLLTICQDIYVAITVDEREDVFRYTDCYELFGMSKKMIHALMQMCQRSGVEMKEPIRMGSGHLGRHSDAPMLHHLEQNILRGSWKPYRGKLTGEIQLLSCMDHKQELSYVAGEIQRLVRKEGYRYKDIAVISGDVEGFGRYVESVFFEYQIPYFLDMTKNILMHPFIEFFRALLDMMIYNFSAETVFRYFRSGLVLAEEDSRLVDLLENYVLASGMKGYTAWNRKLTFLPEQMTQEEVDRLDVVRREQMELLGPLYRKVHRGGTVREISLAFYEVLTKLGIEEKLQAKQNWYAQKNETGARQYWEKDDSVKEKEYAQIYRIVMDLLDKMNALLGEEELSVKEYAQILDAGFEAAKVAVIPTGYDKVTVGDIVRTRLEHIKIIFFIGVNDGIVPKAEARGGIISQLEREELARRQLELAPTARERVFMQRFYLYLMLTKPSQRLYLTCAKIGGDGKALRRSYLYGNIEKLFPGIQVQEIQMLTPKEQLYTPLAAMNFYIDEIMRLQEDCELDENRLGAFRSLQKWYQKDAVFSDMISGIEKARQLRYEGNPISKQLSRQLYGEALSGSVTRLEQFAACACAHFLNYGIGLSEREQREFAVADMGNIYHGSLEAYAKMLEASPYDWYTVPKEERRKLMESALHETILSQGKNTMEATWKNQYILYRMRKILCTTVDVLTSQIRSGVFVPGNYEMSFSFTEDLDAVNFALSEDEKMHLRGRIDRVDTYEEEDKVYVKVIDYKSGKTSFDLLALYHGLQLQLVVYLNAAMEVIQKKHPQKEVLPAGIFYYHIDEPMIEGTGKESDVEIYEAILEKLCLDGMVNETDDVYRKMDENMVGKSSVIPVKENKDGSLSKTSSAFTLEEFQTVQHYVSKTIEQLGHRMMDGEVAAAPYQLDKKDGCAYCEFKSVCGYDSKIPGYEHRKLQKDTSASQIISKMKEAE